MQRQLLFCLAMSVSGLLSAGDRPMDSNPDFEVTAACRNQTPCVFRSRNIHFDVFIKNKTDAPIQLPLEFIRHAGPMVKLRDNHSPRSLIQPTHMRDGALLSNLTVLAPGQSVAVAGLIDASYLRNWGGASADVTAVVTLGAPLGQATEFQLIGTTQFRILGTDAASKASRQDKR